MEKSKIAVIDFQPAHFERLALRAEDARDIEGIDRRELVQSWQQGRTVFYAGEPVFIYCYSSLGGVVSIHAFSSAGAERIPLFLTRLARSFVRGVFQAGAYRVEALCHKHNRRSLAWLTRCLGMRVEGLLRNSGPNKQDRFMLSLIPEDLHE